MIAGGRRAAAGAVAAASVSMLLLLAAAMYAGRGGGEHGDVVVAEEESSGMGGRSARGRHHGKGESLPSISRAWKDLRLAKEEVTTWKKLSEERRSHMPFVPPPGERVPEDEWRVAWAELGCPHKKPDYEIRALGCNRKGGCGAPRPAPPSGTVEECGDRTDECIVAFRRCVSATTPSHRGPTSPDVCLCHGEIKKLGCGTGCADALFYDYGLVTKACWHWDVFEGCKYIDRFRFKDEQLFDHKDGAGVERPGAFDETWPEGWEFEGEEDGEDALEKQIENGGVMGEGGGGEAEEGGGGAMVSDAGADDAHQGDGGKAEDEDVRHAAHGIGAAHSPGKK